MQVENGQLCELSSWRKLKRLYSASVGKQKQKLSSISLYGKPYAVTFLLDEHLTSGH